MEEQLQRGVLCTTKIISVNTVGFPSGAYANMGLGKDGKIYYWDFIDGCWYLNSEMNYQRQERLEFERVQKLQQDDEIKMQQQMNAVQADTAPKKSHHKKIV